MNVDLILIIVVFILTHAIAITAYITGRKDGVESFLDEKTVYNFISDKDALAVLYNELQHIDQHRHFKNMAPEYYEEMNRLYYSLRLAIITMEEKKDG